MRNTKFKVGFSGAIYSLKVTGFSQTVKKIIIKSEAQKPFLPFLAKTQPNQFRGNPGM